jgi:hypothetical protein
MSGCPGTRSSRSWQMRLGWRPGLCTSHLMPSQLPIPSGELGCSGTKLIRWSSTTPRFVGWSPTSRRPYRLPTVPEKSSTGMTPTQTASKWMLQWTPRWISLSPLTEGEAAKSHPGRGVAVVDLVPRLLQGSRGEPNLSPSVTIPTQRVSPGLLSCGVAAARRCRRRGRSR